MSCRLRIWKLTHSLLYLVGSGTALTWGKQGLCLVLSPAKWQSLNFCNCLKSPVYVEALSQAAWFASFFSLAPGSSRLQRQTRTGDKPGCPLLEQYSRCTPRMVGHAWLLLTGVRPTLCGSSPAEANGTFQQGIRPVNCSCTWILIIAAKRSSFYLPSQEGWSAFSARVRQCFQWGRKGKIVSRFCCLRAYSCLYEN